MAYRDISIDPIEDASNFGFELNLKLNALKNNVPLYVTISNNDLRRWLVNFLRDTPIKPGTYSLCCLFCKQAINNEFHWILIDHTGFYGNLWSVIMTQYARNNQTLANAILLREFFLFESDDSFLPIEWFHVHIINLQEMPITRKGWIDLVLRQHDWAQNCLYLKERKDIRLHYVEDDGKFQIVNCQAFYEKLHG